MTKVTKWWKSFSFWNKWRGVIVGLFGLTELGLYAEKVGHPWDLIVLILAVAAFLATYFVKDENKNGIIDIAESAEESAESSTNHIDPGL